MCTRLALLFHWVGTPLTTGLKILFPTMSPMVQPKLSHPSQLLRSNTISRLRTRKKLVAMAQNCTSATDLLLSSVGQINVSRGYVENPESS